MKAAQEGVGPREEGCAGRILRNPQNGSKDRKIRPGGRPVRMAPLGCRCRRPPALRAGARILNCPPHSGTAPGRSTWEAELRLHACSWPGAERTSKCGLFQPRGAGAAQSSPGWGEAQTRGLQDGSHARCTRLFPTSFAETKAEKQSGSPGPGAGFHTRLQPGHLAVSMGNSLAFS